MKIGVFVVSLFLFLSLIGLSSAVTGPHPTRNVYVYKVLPEHENLVFVKIDKGEIVSVPSKNSLTGEYRIHDLHNGYKYNYGINQAGFDDRVLIDMTYEEYDAFDSPLQHYKDFTIVTDEPYVERYFCDYVSIQSQGEFNNDYFPEIINETVKELNNMIDDGRLFTDCKRIDNKGKDGFFNKIGNFFKWLFSRNKFKA